MTNSKLEEMLFDINGTLCKIETRLSSVVEILTQHEHRITTLENTGNGGSDSFKTEMLKLLGKCLVIALTSIAALVGAGGLLAKMLVI